MSFLSAGLALVAVLTLRKIKRGCSFIRDVGRDSFEYEGHGQSVSIFRLLRRGSASIIRERETSEGI